jgi:hypothetical protein
MGVSLGKYILLLIDCILRRADHHVAQQRVAGTPSPRRHIPPGSGTASRPSNPPQTPPDAAEAPSRSAPATAGFPCTDTPASPTCPFGFDARIGASAVRVHCDKILRTRRRHGFSFRWRQLRRPQTQAQPRGWRCPLLPISSRIDADEFNPILYLLHPCSSAVSILISAR